MAIKINEEFARAVDNVAKDLVTTEHFGTASLIKTPVKYPSGANSVVQVTEMRNRYFVTDMGIGHQEAEMIGASLLYTNSARPLAEQFGIRFDNQAFFVAECNKEQLAAAVVIVANCSSEAAMTAAHKAAERRYEEDNDILYHRLAKVFPAGEIVRDADFVGSSTHKWPVAAIVSHNDRTVIFEPVNKHHASIVNAAVKFQDISRLEVPPHRVAMVKRKSELGNYLNILSQSAKVVEYDAPDATLVKIAEAA